MQTSDPIRAIAAGLLSSGLLMFGRYLVEKHRSRSRKEVTLGSIHTKGIKDIFDNYQRQVDTYQKQVEDFRKEVDNLREELFAQATRHKAEIATKNAIILGLKDYSERIKAEVDGFVTLLPEPSEALPEPPPAKGRRKEKK